MQQHNENQHFTIRQSGNIGLEVLSPRGKVVAWATDRIIARIVAERLNEFFDAPAADEDGDDD